MNTPKKKKSTTTITTQDAIKSVAEAILEELKNKNQEEMEVFEVYTHVLHSKIHNRLQDYPTSLVKGYAAMMNQIEKNLKSEI